MMKTSITLYKHYWDYVDNEVISDLELVKKLDIILSEEQIDNLDRMCVELMHDSFRLSIIHNKLFEWKVIIEVLRIPLSEMEQESLGVEKKLKDVIDYLEETNESNVTLFNKDKKIVTDKIFENGDIIQIQQHDFLDNDYEEILNYLKNEGIDYEIVSTQSDKSEAGASGGFVRVIIQIFNYAGNFFTVVEGVKGLTEYGEVDSLSKQTAEKIKKSASNYLKIHIDQLVPIYLKSDSETNYRYVIYQHRRLFYGFVFDDAGEIKSMMRSENDSEIMESIFR